MRIIDPDKTPTGELHQLLVSSVAPRPIAFVSTVNADGVYNLAPYSFFNVFSSNPPVMIFSSNRRVSDNTTKDTLHNVQKNGEVVINIVPFALVRQAALASQNWPADVSEFAQTGLTPIPGSRVRAARVAESPVQFECTVRQIIPLGDGGGAGHLVICQVVLIHADETIFDEQGRINPHQLDLVGRMGRAFYTRASGESIYRIYQPFEPLGIGYDALPENVRRSRILTGNDLARLAACTEVPTDATIAATKNIPEVIEVLQGDQPLEELHRLAQQYLEMEQVEAAAAMVWLGATTTT